MRILIVDDQKAKADRIELALRRPDNVTLEVERAETLTAFYARTRYSVPDIVVLDMTFDVNGEKTGAEDAAGIEALQALGTKEIPTKVIIATQHNEFDLEVATVHGIPARERIRSAEELEQKLRRLFPEMVVGLVKVDLASAGWEEQLLALYFECISVS